MKGAAFLTLGFVIAVILCCSSLLFSFSQTTNAPFGDTSSTSGGTLDVKLESTPNPIKTGQETTTKLPFSRKAQIQYKFI